MTAIFHYPNHDPAADRIDMHLFEKSGGVKRLVGFVDLGRTDPAARAGLEIGLGWSRPRPADCLPPRSNRRLCAAATPTDAIVMQPAPTSSPPRTRQQRASPRATRATSPMRYEPFFSVWPLPHRNRQVLGLTFVEFYSVSVALQMTFRPSFPFSLKKLPGGNGYEVARWRMSLKVAKIINMTTIASPMRNPTSCARSDSGRPRTASIA